MKRLFVLFKRQWELEAYFVHWLAIPSDSDKGACARSSRPSKGKGTEQLARLRFSD